MSDQSAQIKLNNYDALVFQRKYFIVLANF